MNRFLKVSLYSAVFIVCCIVIVFSGSRGLSILPPLIAIGLAFITKQVLISLFCGVWSGALIILFNKGNSFVFSFFSGFLKTADTYVVQGLNEESHIMIVLFSLMIGGMVGIITASGGMHGIVNALSKRTNTGSKSLILSWASGVLIFFDDYANTLIVGNTMRPLTDRYKVSREKLSFVVDATSAPVASLAILSTWIGYEVGLIGDALKNSVLDVDPYSVFIYSLPYRFYAIILILFLPLYITMKRDFGPMYDAEKRVKNDTADYKHSVSRDFNSFVIPDASRCKWYSAAIPIIVLIVATFSGIIISGYMASDGDNPSIQDIISNANSFKVLMWGSLISSLTAAVTMIVSKNGTVTDAVNAWTEGVKSMITAMVILVLAWGLSAVITELKTAENLSFFLSGTIPLWSFPAIVFVTASIASFATGTSWGTMALLFPTALPLALTLAQNGAVPIDSFVFIVTGAILTGSIFGDHCSPISDTTIMSSMSCNVSHIEHVRTQMPYAVTIGAVALFLGYLPAGFFINPLLLIVIQFAVVFLIFRYLGRKQAE
ncbi:MAG TPA: Na+/H+ antiporter NhaC family protein [bacterium]|nr:Na+/H+ antiporter NhaC family protein [bacterium]HPS28678.1 Na+/H+ antiporter NhaC family protein [bacterium]